jgi:hypothetical protein
VEVLGLMPDFITYGFATMQYYAYNTTHESAYSGRLYTS